RPLAGEVRRAERAAGRRRRRSGGRGRALVGRRDPGHRGSLSPGARGAVAQCEPAPHARDRAEPPGPAGGLRMETMNDFLVGVRLRATALTDDYRVGELELHVGDFVVVETPTSETAVGEGRPAKREVPESKKDRAYRRVLRIATEAEVREYRDRRTREERAIVTCQRVARGRGLQLKVVDVEMYPVARRATVYFSAEERVDFRELVRDLAHELHAR